MIPALIICWVGVSFLIDEIGKSEGFELIMIWAIVIIIIFSMIFHTVHLFIFNKNKIYFKLGVMYFPKKFWSKNSIAIPLVEITNVVENNFYPSWTVLNVEYDGGKIVIFKSMLPNKESFIDMKNILLSSLHAR
jgi:hypothetical protein